MSCRPLVEQTLRQRYGSAVSDEDIYEEMIQVMGQTLDGLSRALDEKNLTTTACPNACNNSASAGTMLH
jgi:hypothetical protein